MVPNMRTNYQSPVDYAEFHPALRNGNMSMTTNYGMNKNRSNHTVQRRSMDSSTMRTKSGDESSSSKSSSNSRPNISRAGNNGQAEQLRRSRESNTFALIDGQLSKPPLDQIRDMYLQVKGVSSSNGNAPRTTKKANLSAVHTIVRFRIRDYLIELKDHSRRLLETLVNCEKSDYDAHSLHETCGILTALPCSRDCEYCERIQSRWDKLRSSRRVTCPSRALSNSSIQSSRSHHTMSHQTSSATILSSSSYLSPRPFSASSTSSNGPSINGDLSCPDSLPRCNLRKTNNPARAKVENDQHSNSIDEPFVDFPILESDFKGRQFNLQDSKMLSTNLDHPRTRRNRLDSTAAKLCSEIDFNELDWSASGIDFGPCGEEPVDIQSLLMDPNNDPLGDTIANFKCDSIDDNYLNPDSIFNAKLLGSPYSVSPAFNSEYGFKSDSMLFPNDLHLSELSVNTYQ